MCCWLLVGRVDVYRDIDALVPHRPAIYYHVILYCRDVTVRGIAASDACQICSLGLSCDVYWGMASITILYIMKTVDVVTASTHKQLLQSQEPFATVETHTKQPEDAHCIPGAKCPQHNLSHRDPYL